MRIEERIQRTLSDRLANVEASEDAWVSIEQRLGQRQPTSGARRLLVACFALLLSAGALAGLWAAFRGGPAPRTPATQTLSPNVALKPRIDATIQVGSYPSGVAVLDGFVWVVVEDAVGLGKGDRGVVKIDSETNEVLETIPIEGAGDITSGAGALWVTSYEGQKGVVRRIDPATDEVVATIPVGSDPSNLEFGADSVWVTMNHSVDPPAGAVIRIDPTINKVMAQIPIDNGWPRDIAIGEGYVWVSGPSKESGDTLLASSLWRIDPESDQLVDTVIDQTGALSEGIYTPDSVSVGEGVVWAADDRGNAVRIDPTTGAATMFPVKGGFWTPFMVFGGSVWFGGQNGLGRLDAHTLEVKFFDLQLSSVHTALDPSTRTLWIADYKDTVTRIEFVPVEEPTPSTATATATAGVTDRIDVGRATSVTYGEGSLWVSINPVDSSDRSILRIDPQTNEVLATIPTTVVPGWEIGGGGLEVANGGVWVAGGDGSGGLIVRIDPSTNSVVNTISLSQGDVADVAVDGATAWALIRGNPGRPEVVRIDLSTDQVVATIPLEGGYGRFIFAEGGSVLAAIVQPPGGPFDSGTLVRIDPSTNEVAGSFDLGTYPSVAAGDGTMWAVTDRGLIQIDSATGQPTGTSGNVPCTGDALAEGAGGVWCFDPARDRALVRFNPGTSQVDVAMSPDQRTGGTALTTSPGSVWVLNGTQLLRIDLGV